MNYTLKKQSRVAAEQSGFTLIEVLVTVLILAVGSLGIASLQLAGLKYTSGSYARTQAIILADDMANRIKSNRAFAVDLQEDGSYGGDTTRYQIAAFGAAATSTNNCLQATCDTQEIADYDRATWLAEIARVLPAGQGQVTIFDRVNTATGDTERQFNIAVRWRQIANSTTSNGNEDDEVKDFTFRISM